jgi:hypothetical protein
LIGQKSAINIPGQSLATSRNLVRIGITVDDEEPTEFRHPFVDAVLLLCGSFLSVTLAGVVIAAGVGAFLWLFVAR